MKHIYIILLFIISLSLNSQEIPIHISSTAIYDYIDELSLLHIVDVNNVIKPYTDKFVYSCLKKAQNKKEELNKRQKKELAFYLKEFSYIEGKSKSKSHIPYVGEYLDKFNLSLIPPGYRYRDSLLYLEIRPIWGIQYFKNDKGTNFHRWGGGSFNMTIGEHFAAFASIRDNNISELFARKEYFTPIQGGTYKGRSKGGGDFSEMRGGISYSWDWGSVSMVKDHLEWGSNYHGANIFSSKPPSFAQIKLHLKPSKWFEFNSFHGWLVSNVIDSTRSYTTSNGKRRDVMHPKYVAANMFTITPFEKIHLSFGNSIIYSDMNPHPAYLIPFMFYKSVDHWLNNTDGAGTGVGQNSQMFVNFSILRFKHFNFYGTLFVDELKIARIKEPDKYNPIGYKIGFKHSNGLIDNLSFVFEYTRTKPITYEHNISTTTFESNGYNLGHYLRSNSDELYFSASYKPISRLFLQTELIYARHGNSFEYINGTEAVTHPFMQEVRWQNKIINLLTRYEFAYNSFLNISYQYNISTGEDLKLFTPDFYQGENHTFSFGFNLGF